MDLLTFVLTCLAAWFCLFFGLMVYGTTVVFYREFRSWLARH